MLRRGNRSPGGTATARARVHPLRPNCALLPADKVADKDLDKGPLISRTGKGNSVGNSQGNRSNYTGARARGRDHAMDSLLTAAQAADRLGTSVRFIRRLVAQRRIPYLKVGRHLRISSDDLDAFIAAGRVEAEVR